MLDKVVIGSEALYMWGFPLGRKPKDCDYIGTFEAYQEFVKINKHKIRECYPLSSDVFVIKFKKGLDNHDIVEFQIAWEGSNSEELLRILSENGYLVSGYFVSPAVVLALKLSHRYKKNSPHFKKTMKDIRSLRKAGYEVPEVLKEWFKRREKDTYNYSLPNLKQNGSDFFEKTDMFYKYNHDDIHEAVVVNDKPMYMSILKDGEEVFCDKEKFARLPLVSKLECVLEEAYVLALERHQIPNNFEPDPLKSFEIALMKICTSITSGWFREYAWENYEWVVAMYEEDYVDKFRMALTKGEVRDFERK